MSLAPPAAPIGSASPLDRRQDAGAGILWMVLAVGIFSVMDTLAKWQAETYHVAQLIFFRSFFGLMVLLPFLMRGRGVLVKLRSRQIGLHIVRSFFGLAALFAFFQSVRYLELADAVVLSFASPLFLTGLSVLLLGEHVGWRRWAAILVGFVGVLVMMQPGGDLFTLYALLPLAGALAYAVVGIFIRVLARTEETVTIVFYFGLFATLATAVMLPFVWIAPRDAMDWVAQIAIGVCGGFAQMAMTNAFSRAPLAVVAPFDYTAIIWSVMFGYVVWGDMPALTTWAGTGIVVASGLYILHRETRRRPPG
ncbi:DMT family transporter [Zavarzinia compransoris]|uniref:DMT family transporter n=1 Tax=Zavarzinia marina TaxID=2911065 RepID=UPI001F1A2DAE|nr:DMT family transporter [Zavarzinia marina]MCF4164391.1 DMT family transporter [Zavarzinia marina]